MDLIDKIIERLLLLLMESKNPRTQLPQLMMHGEARIAVLQSLSKKPHTKTLKEVIPDGSEWHEPKVVI